MQVIGHHFASWNSTEDRHILSTRYQNAKLAIVHGESRGACMHARKWLGAPQPCSQHARKWFGDTSTLLATKRLASEASPRMACGSLTRPWLCGPCVRSFSRGQRFFDRVLKRKRYQGGGCQLVLCACLLYTSPSPRDATLSRMPAYA